MRHAVIDYVSWNEDHHVQPWLQIATVSPDQHACSYLISLLLWCRKKWEATKILNFLKEHHHHHTIFTSMAAIASYLGIHGFTTFRVAPWWCLTSVPCPLCRYRPTKGCLPANYCSDCPTYRLSIDHWLNSRSIAPYCPWPVELTGEGTYKLWRNHNDTVIYVQPDESSFSFLIIIISHRSPEIGKIFMEPGGECAFCRKSFDKLANFERHIKLSIDCRR